MAWWKKVLNLVWGLILRCVGINLSGDVYRQLPAGAGVKLKVRF